MNISDASQQRSSILSPHSKHRAKSTQHGDPKRGKLLLVVIFCALRAIDVLIVFGTPPGRKSQLFAALIVGAVWTTTLLIAVWHRQNWARYMIALLLAAGAISSMILTPEVYEQARTAKSLPIIMTLTGLANALIAWCLISSRHIRRLTSRSHA